MDMPANAWIDERFVDLSALTRFVDSAPILSKLLAGAAVSSDELLLRNVMRRAIRQLSVALDEAAGLERSVARAAAYRAASLVAAELAGGAAAKRLGH